MDIFQMVVSTIAFVVGVCLIAAVFNISKHTRRSSEELAIIRASLIEQAKRQNGPKQLVDNQVSLPDQL